MLDALLQLASANTRKLLLTHNEFDVLFTADVNFMAIIVQISDKLQEQMLNKYKTNN